MPASPWPSNHADPRRAVRVGRARVQVRTHAGGDETVLSAGVWQQRIEDALRCAHFGTGQRLVLLRKLQVHAGSASAPGWAGVVEAAAQDAVARACNGRSPGAEQSPAVWFENWDDAVAAWLDAALRWPAQRVSPHAWFWPRIAKMAGVVVRTTSHPSAESTRAVTADSLVMEQARAMLVRWQADPASQRACSEWLAQRPAFREWLQPEETASTVASSEASAANESQRGEEHDAARSISKALESDAGTSLADVQAHARKAAQDEAAATHETLGSHAAHAASDAGLRDDVSESRDQAVSAPASTDASRITSPDTTTRAVDQVVSQRTDLHLADATPVAVQSASDLAAGDAKTASSGLRVDDASVVLRGASDAGASTAPAAAPVEPSISALGWTHLRRTQLGGLPLTINALQRLGFADELRATALTLDRHDQLIAASAPWLAVWSRLGPQARQRWVRDPMFAALPAFDAIAALPAHEWADALLARWQAQPPAVRQLGRHMWRRLQRAAQSSGWRSPRAWLQRPAWMQLNATHLDVIFALDQADLSVRRLGLDADSGWVPWLGRIVSLHFEPANELPTWSTP